MYAVIETGGKQYRVEVGTELEVELLDVEPGDSIELGRVLLVADGDDTSIGQPVVANAAVQAEVLRRDRGDKVIVFKYRPKARTRVKKGHRQDHTVLRVTDVTLNGKSAAEASRKADRVKQSERQRLEEAAARQAAADAELAARLASEKAPKAGRGAKASPRNANTATPSSAPTTGITPEQTTAPQPQDAPEGAGPDAAAAPEPATEATITPEATAGPRQATAQDVATE